MLNLTEIEKQLVNDEGLKQRPYLDSKGIWTVGVGRNLDANGITKHEAHLLGINPYKDAKGMWHRGESTRTDNDWMTKDEAIILLRNDINACVADLSKFTWFTGLCYTRKNVMINMCFNLGIPKLLKFKRMIAAIERKDYKMASIEMLDSDWAPEVKGRALRLARIMELG